MIKRARRRARSLGLADLTAYRAHLETHADEWAVFDSFCRVTISRFYREAAVFELLRRELLPGLASRARARGDATLRGLCLGAAGGEEPYSLRIAWDHVEERHGVDLSVVAIEADPEQVARARAGVYHASTLSELPDAFRSDAFERVDDAYRIRDAVRRGVELRPGDIRDTWPEGPFDLVLCRNLAFTYFDDALARETLERIRASLRPGGVLVIGRQDRLPGAPRFAEVRAGTNVLVLR